MTIYLLIESPFNFMYPLGRKTKEDFSSMKTCFKCGVEKEFDAFYKHPRMKDGRVNKCKECNKKDVRENRASKQEYYRAYDRERGYREYDPQKAKARRAVRKLKRPAKCTSCHAVGAVEGHHKDYDKPLDVVWLCKPCHSKVHTF